MGQAKRKAELLPKVEAEAVRWGDRLIRLELDLSTMLIITSALQLALRHPTACSMKSAQTIRKFLFQFKEQVGAEDYPALQELIELGFHRRYDE